MSLPLIAYPGLRLPVDTSKPHLSGPGTHIYNSQIHASLAGQIVKSPIPSSSTQQSQNTLSVLRPSAPNEFSITSNTLPKVGSIILAKVTRVTARQVNLGILVVDDSVCGDEWAGVIRHEDIRGWEKEKVITFEGFRVGDVVRGEVISLGDQANYYVTTARNDLGVLIAKSEFRNQMVPVSWKEFKDPVTGMKEGRKVAKPC